MDQKSKVRARKKEVILDMLRWLKSESLKRHATFMKNSHGVYRDETAQWKAEIEERLIEEVIDKINEFREIAYVPVDGRVENKVGEKGEEKEETQTSPNSGRIDST
jgi:hypothetical protein